MNARRYKGWGICVNAEAELKRKKNAKELDGPEARATKKNQR